MKPSATPSDHWPHPEGEVARCITLPRTDAALRALVRALARTAVHEALSAPSGPALPDEVSSP